MLTRNKRGLLLFIAAFLTGFKLSEQAIEKNSLVVNSLENVKTLVHIHYDLVDDKITLSLPSAEKLILSEYRGLNEEINLLDEKFILFNFRIRGGSGVALNKTVLVCISNGKFFIAADMISTENDETLIYNKSLDSILPNEIRKYELKIIKLLYDEQGYSIIAREHDIFESRENPNKNYVSTDTIKLNFDKAHKVFYSYFENLKVDYTMDDEKMRYFGRGNYPVLEIKEGAYCFWDNQWHFKDRSNNLMEHP